MAKNLTLAVDEAELNGARIYAAKRATTVNALVRKYLASLNDREERRAAAIERMRERSENGPRATYAPPFDRASLWDRESKS